MSDLLQTLQTLCRLDGPSGFEDSVREHIKHRIAPHVTSLHEDVMGNLIAYKEGKSTPDKKIMFAAHMDEVGFIVKQITDEGFLKFAPLGGIDTRVILGKRVLVGEHHHPGILGIKAVHMTTPEDRKVVPKITEMYIDIGATTKDEAQALTAPGDYIVFDSDPTIFGDGLLKARAIDDRVGCATMIHLIEEGPDVTAWYAFTVQEEVGTRGSGPAAYAVQPDIAIILEGTTAGDMPGTEPHRRVCAPGKGAVLPFMDNSAIYDPKLHKELVQIAASNNIPCQLKEYVSGGTDAGTIQRTATGIRVAAISAAVRYIHSPSCVAAIDDFESIYRLAGEFLKTAGGQHA